MYFCFASRALSVQVEQRPELAALCKCKWGQDSVRSVLGELFWHYLPAGSERCPSTSCSDAAHGLQGVGNSLSLTFPLHFRRSHLKRWWQIGGGTGKQACSWPSKRFTPRLTFLCCVGGREVSVLGPVWLHTRDHAHRSVAEWRPCLEVVELGLSVVGGQKPPQRSETHHFVPSGWDFKKPV